MAVVDATRELEPRESAPIGWDGRTLSEMLTESERQFADTGSYCGLSGELELMRSDPIGYEKLFSRLRGGLVSSDPVWMELREFGCPSCSRMLEVECSPPGYPVVHEFLPDVEGFYRGWLGRDVPA